MKITIKQARKHHRQYVKANASSMSLKAYVRANRNAYFGASGKLAQILA